MLPDRKPFRPKKIDYTKPRDLYVFGEWKKTGGLTMHTYPTIEDLAKRFGISESAIAKASGREQWMNLRNNKRLSPEFDARKYEVELGQTAENLSETCHVMSQTILEETHKLRSHLQQKEGLITSKEVRLLESLAKSSETAAKISSSLYKAKIASVNVNGSSRISALRASAAIAETESEIEREQQVKLRKRELESRRIKKITEDKNRVAFDDPEYIEQYGVERSREMIKRYPNQTMENMSQYQAGGDRHAVWLKTLDNEVVDVESIQEDN